MFEIERSPRGYYILTVNGKFEGNYDTVSEATNEAEEILRHSQPDKKAEDFDFLNEAFYRLDHGWLF